MFLKVGSPLELTPTVLQVLSKNGVKTAEQLLRRDPHSLPLDTSLVLNLQRKIYSKIVLEPQTLSQLYQRAVDNQAIISTGDRNVDELLGGGFFTGEHVDICGDPDVRSKFCLRSMSELVREDPGASVVYVDSGSNFHPEEMVEVFKSDLEHLNRVQVVFPSGISELLTFLDQTHLGRLRPRMIVINAFVDIVKPFMINNDPIAALGLLNHVAATIRSLAVHLKLSLLTTNDFINDEPALGKMWLGSPHMRIAVKGLGDVVVLKSTRKTLAGGTGEAGCS
ncbi:DNA repair protein RAD51 homolog 4 [Galendromus occidentalis]|uniref:DNA repair protein RAD51 homolog 4 n=1 Tax=Galendromus occidentalis TaxID=34638 RepID=A0AAJ6QWR4_9ACAR|nr:DNA repair protein RAD51 homolog 4 [Galendromus occidentalis]